MQPVLISAAVTEANSVVVDPVASHFQSDLTEPARAVAEPEGLAETAGGSCEQPFGPGLGASGFAACRLHLVQCQAACHCEPAGLVGGPGEVPADQELVAEQPVPYLSPAAAALGWVHAVGAGAQHPLLGQPGVACRAAWLGPAPACKAHAAHADLHAVPAVLLGPAKPAEHGLPHEASHQGLPPKPLKGLAEPQPLCPGTPVRDPKDPWAAAVHLHWD